MSWRSRIIEGLVLLVVATVTARAVWGVLGKFIPMLLVLLVVGWLISRLIGGPRAKH